MTGPITLAGNASLSLQAVPLQQMQAADAALQQQITGAR